MKAVLAWLDQNHLQRLLVWFVEEGKQELSQQDAEGFSEVLKFSYIHRQASASDIWQYLRDQIERRAALYAETVETPPHSRQTPPSLRDVAREASAKEFIEPTGGLSYEEARALLDRASHQWLWVHVTNPTMRHVQEPPLLSKSSSFFASCRPTQKQRYPFLWCKRS
jgi:hypothetical protein